MNTIILILAVLTTLLTTSVSIFLLYSIRSQSYLKYKQKLIDFENKKKRIEEDLENDRKRFKRNF